MNFSGDLVVFLRPKMDRIMRWLGLTPETWSLTPKYLETKWLRFFISRASWTDQLLPTQLRFWYPSLPGQTNFALFSYDFDIQPFLDRPISPYSATILISSLSWTDQFPPTLFSYPTLSDQTYFIQPCYDFHIQPFLNRPIFPIFFPNAPAGVWTRVAWFNAARPNKLSCTDYIAMSIVTFASSLQAMCKLGRLAQKPWIHLT